MTDLRSRPGLRPTKFARCLLAGCAVLAALLAVLPQEASAQPVPRRARAAQAPAPSMQAVPDGGGTMSQSLSAPVIDDKTAEYIVAVINQDPITSTDLNQRLLRVMQENPPADSVSRQALRQQVLDTLIDERVQLSYAQETGMRVDDADIDRAIESIASQNQITVKQLRDRLQQEGQDYSRFRRSLRDRILLERVRDRDVPPRIRIAESEIDGFISEQLGQPVNQREILLAHILVQVPDGADEVTVNERRARAERVLAQARAGEDWIRLVADFSDDLATRDNKGEFGWRVEKQVPDAFIEASTTLGAGSFAPSLVRTGRGFHVLRLIDRREAVSGYTIVQSHARHILLRASGSVSGDLAYKKLLGIRQQIVDGMTSFALMARQHSQDGTATRGGDLGWASPGQFVPEFQQALDRMQPGQISMPVTTRFGLHLIQLLERRDVPVDPKQLRDNARSALREQRFDAAYQEWARDLRSQAYIELRDPPAAR